MTALLLVLASYLIGSTPTSYLAGRWTRGIDLREHGSGNLGATNTFRVLGAGIAAPVMVVDVLKGFLPTALFTAWDGEISWAWGLAYGAAAIIGHVFSAFTNFRGGKGVATAAGVFMALAPYAVLPAFVVWLTVLAIWRMVSLASIVAAATMIIALMLTEPRLPVLLLGIGVGAFVVYAHRTNIRRILRGEEYRFGKPRVAADAVASEEGP
ncbi:MAG: glycerol-3-phosphate 1-O-acyltransferase PlsY [Gemmatimonadetes bacterium]|nr:glycerol-3-phosphate 1-O-acyltransferase PlsY [Gemmatimonadota bacterium]